jgi:trk system potassium uptake protein TrkA
VYTIVVGAGATGYHIAYLLVKAGQEVVVVEQSEELAEHIRYQLDVGIVLGNAVNPDILRQADVGRADLLVATMASDEANMVICSMAKEMGTERTIARVRNPEYHSGLRTVVNVDSPDKARKVERPIRMGIDRFVNPEIETAIQIENILSGLYASHARELAGGRVQVRGFKIENGSEMISKTLHVVEKMLLGPCVVALLVHSKEVKVPGGDDVISEGDIIYIVAKKEDMDKLGDVFNYKKKPTRHLIILGGGLIGFHVAEALSKRGIHVKLIEKNKVRSEEISARLRRVEVLHSVGTDHDFLVEQGVKSCDAFIATTGDESLNILVGLLAKSIGAARNIVVVDKPEYLPLAESVGIDVALSPLIIAAEKIISIALHQNSVSTVLLDNEQAQATEFTVSAKAKICGQSKGGVKLPKGAVMAAIIHDNNITVSPAEDEIIQENDHVIIVSLLSTSSAIEKLFKNNNAN